MSETKPEMPFAGGSYERQADGKLALVERTEPIAGPSRRASRAPQDEGGVFPPSAPSPASAEGNRPPSRRVKKE